MPDAETITFRPRRLQLICGIIGSALCLLFVVGWFALPLSLRETFTTFQRLTLLIFLAAIVFVIAAMAASSVTASAEGLKIRNGLRTHWVGWERVHKIILRPGDPWAFALIKPADGAPFEIDLDAEKRQLMGIQSSEGERATAAVEQLQSRLHHFS